VAVLKGRGTVVAEPAGRGGRVWINATGNPGMATAGAGDVLTGILGAYLALSARAESERFGAFEAACHAVWVHGRAGDLAVTRVGRRGLVASDMIAALPAVQGAGP
jgi:NAD(P)H-hydrate epimerase